MLATATKATKINNCRKNFDNKNLFIMILVCYEALPRTTEINQDVRCKMYFYP
jgi:hypothetical protein